MKPNIDSRGRVLRGGIAAVLLIAGVVSFADQMPLLGAILTIAGLFCAFEAWRGWCAARACGIKTPL